MAHVASYIVSEISDGVYLLRLNDDRTQYFESLWHIPEHIVYNAYLIEGDGGWILIDTWKGNFAEELLNAIREVADPSKIKYVILNHAEPDHTGSLVEVLEKSPEARVVAHSSAEKVLHAKHSLRNELVKVEGRSRLSLLGVELEFMHVPWVHWPETIFTYQHNAGILYTCDVFGSYSIPPGIYASPDDQAYLRYAEKYLLTVMGFYRKFVISAIEKVRSANLKVSIIAPSHGGLWRGDIEAPLRLFEKWAKAEPVPGTVLIAYVTMYGSVESSVGRIARALSAMGKRVLYHAINDTVHPDVEDFIVDANESEYIVLATPTYDNEPHPEMLRLLEVMKQKFRGIRKKVVIMVSYGWGSNAQRTMERELSQMGMEIVASEAFRERISDEQVDRILSAIR